MTDNKPQTKPRTFWLAKPDLDFDLNWKQVHAAEFPHKNTLVDCLEVVERSALTQANAEIERLKGEMPKTRLDNLARQNWDAGKHVGDVELAKANATIARLSAEVEQLKTELQQEYEQKTLWHDNYRELREKKNKENVSDTQAAKAWTSRMRNETHINIGVNGFIAGIKHERTKSASLAAELSVAKEAFEVAKGQMVLALKKRVESEEAFSIELEAARVALAEVIRNSHDIIAKKHCSEALARIEAFKGGK